MLVGNKSDLEGE